MKLLPPDGQRFTRAESHAALELVLKGGLHPLAECREIPEEGTGLVLYEVHDGPADKPPQPDVYIADAEERQLKMELDRLVQMKRINALRAEVEALTAEVAALDTPKEIP